MKYVASPPPSPPGLGRGRPRAQGQRVIASQHDLACWPPHTPSSLLRYFCEKQKSATLRILQKVLPLHLPAARSHLPAQGDQPPQAALTKSLAERQPWRSKVISNPWQLVGYICVKKLYWLGEVGCRMEEKVRQGSTPAAPSGVDLSLAGVALALKQG